MTIRALLDQQRANIQFEELSPGIAGGRIRRGDRKGKARSGGPEMSGARTIASAVEHRGAFKQIPRHRQLVPQRSTSVVESGRGQPQSKTCRISDAAKDFAAASWTAAVLCRFSSPLEIHQGTPRTNLRTPQEAASSLGTRCGFLANGRRVRPPMPPKS
jgi:hypothetical protein